MYYTRPQAFALAYTQAKTLFVVSVRTCAAPCHKRYGRRTHVLLLLRACMRAYICRVRTRTVSSWACRLLDRCLSPCAGLSSSFDQGISLRPYICIWPDKTNTTSSRTWGHACMQLCDFVLSERRKLVPSAVALHACSRRNKEY